METFEIRVSCNKCNHVYIEPDRPYPECPKCGNTSVTFIEFTEAELAADAETATKFIMDEAWGYLNRNR